MTNFAREDIQVNSPISRNLDDTIFSPSISRASQTTKKAKNHSMSQALLSTAGFEDTTGGLSAFAVQLAKKEGLKKTRAAEDAKNLKFSMLQKFTKMIEEP